MRPAPTRPRRTAPRAGLEAGTAGGEDYPDGHEGDGPITSTAAIGASGGIAGALIAQPVVTRLGRLRSWLLALWAVTVLIGVLAVAPGWVGIGATLCLLQLLLPAANVVVMSKLLRTIPDEIRGRVMSAVLLALTGLSAPGPLLAGVLVDRLGSTSAIIVAAPALIGAALVTCIPSVSASVADHGSHAPASLDHKRSCPR